MVLSSLALRWCRTSESVGSPEWDQRDKKRREKQGRWQSCRAGHLRDSTLLFREALYRRGEGHRVRPAIKAAGRRVRQRFGASQGVSVLRPAEPVPDAE